MKKIFFVSFLLLFVPMFFSQASVDVWIYKESLSQKQFTFSTKEECVKQRDEYLKNILKQEVSECVKSTIAGYPIISNNPDPVVPITPKGKNESTSSAKYKLLAPIGSFTEAPENVGDYLNKIFLIAIGLCGALAVLMLIIAGIQYMGEESIFGKVDAKGKIGDALFGLGIALVAYALLNTIDPRILNGGIKIKAVTLAIDPEVHGDNPQSAINGKYCDGKYKDKQTWLSDEKERTLVKNAGITINKDNCTYVGQQNCTSLAGLNTANVIALKKSSCPNCDVVITGGTECWLHSKRTQHLPGNSIVDLSLSTSLISYVEKNNTKLAATGMNFPVYVKNTTKFMREPNHYHIISW